MLTLRVSRIGARGQLGVDDPAELDETCGSRAGKDRHISREQNSAYKLRESRVMTGNGFTMIA
jgi:hypothetical protein